MVQRQRLAAFGKPRQLMIMGGEQAAAGNVVMDRLHHGPGDRQPVIGAGAAPDFIQDHEAVRGRLRQDRRRLDHFDHEGRSATRQIVGGADPAEQPVDQTQPGSGGRHEAARLRQYRDQRVLAQKGGFAAHIGAGDEPQPRVRPQGAIIRHKAFAAPGKGVFDHRVAPARHLEHRVIGERGPCPAGFHRAFGKRGGDIKPGQRIGGGGNRRAPGERQRGQFLEMRRFRRQRMRTGLCHFERHFVQVGRVEAHRTRHRLAVGESAPLAQQRVAMPRGHFDMIAKHRIVADLQRRDPGLGAIARLQRGNRPPPARAGRAQIIKRGVIAFRDIAALAGINGRRGDERAGERVNERAMPLQLRHEHGEQRWHRVDPRQPLGQCPGRAQPVAQLAQIARGAAPRHQPPQRAADVACLAQGIAQGAALAGIVGEQLHQVEPRFDLRPVHQRRGNVRRQQPRAGAGHAAVDRVEQAALAPAALRLGQLQAVARRWIDRHRVCRARQARRMQRVGRRFAGIGEIVDQPARRCQCRPAERAERIERRHAEQRLQPRFAGAALKPGAGPNCCGERGKGAVLRCQYLSRVQPGEFGGHRLDIGLDNFEPPGRDIGGGNRHPARRRPDRAAPVAGARVEQRFLGQRARRYHPHDRARDQRLGTPRATGGLGAFGLLGNRHAVPGLDEPREIPFRRMHRHPAHRHRRPVMLAARGERDVEHRACHFGIIEEQLEEIAHAIEEQAVLCLGLQRQILGHHRGGGGGHAHPG